MLLHPAIIALLLSSLIIGFMLIYSSYYGLRIYRRWDIGSGSELQLDLERRTYLISTILSYVLGFELLSLFLYVYTADNLHSLFVGAMCAAGTLNVNGYGYPSLIVKICNFMLAGLWLIVNYADNRAYDYPLTRTKYLLLLFITPFVLAEGVLQTEYFLNLKADVITSCCGSLFGSEGGGVASDIAALPLGPTRAVFYSIMALTLISGIVFLVKRKGGYLYGLLSLAAFSAGIISIISFISLYVYELPTHHCPFCILQGSYNYAGYAGYAALFGASVTGMGVGVLMAFRRRQSLGKIVPLLQRRLALVSVLLFLTFLVIVLYWILSSGLTLE